MKIGYLVNIAGTLMGLYATSYLIYVRIKRKSILAKYKPGTPAFEMYQKLFNPISLIISLAITLLFVSGLFGAKNSGSSSNGSQSSFVFIMVIIVFSVTLFGSMNKYRKKGNNTESKKKDEED